MDHNWDFATVFQSRELLLLGLGNTVMLGLLCLAIGLSAGLVVGAGRYSRNPLFNWPATAFVELFRNTPALVQIMWFFFAFPIISPFDIDAFTAATQSSMVWISLSALTQSTKVSSAMRAIGVNSSISTPISLRIGVV